MTDNDNVTGIRARGDASAAQDTWSAGEAIVQEACRAREEGRCEDALRHLLAAFARMDSTDRQRHIDGFMVMLEWRFLAEEYPPARAAMRDARDAQVARLLGGELTYGLARNEWLGPRSRLSLIAEMNEALRDPHSTSAVFSRLAALNPAQARRDAFVALPSVVEAGDFALAERFLPDPMAFLPHLNETARSWPLFPPPRTAPRLAGELANFARELRVRAATLRGLERGAEADVLLDAAMAGLANDELRDWVRRDIRWPGVIHRVLAEHHMEQQQEQEGTHYPHLGARLPPQQVLETERLILRPFTADDAEAWLPLISLIDIVRYTGDTPAGSVEEARESLCNRPLRDYTLYGFGRLAVIEKGSGRMVGFCGFKYVVELGEVDIGYRFLPECWGKGYATESAAALMQHRRRVHDIRRVVAIVHPDNPASCRVLEKLGLRFERLLEPDEGGVRFLLYASD